jgi:hypothetical protein
MHGQLTLLSEFSTAPVWASAIHEAESQQAEDPENHKEQTIRNASLDVEEVFQLLQEHHKNIPPLHVFRRLSAPREYTSLERTWLWPPDQWAPNWQTVFAEYDPGTFKDLSERAGFSEGVSATAEALSFFCEHALGPELNSDFGLRMSYLEGQTHVCPSPFRTTSNGHPIFSQECVYHASQVQCAITSPVRLLTTCQIVTIDAVHIFISGQKTLGGQVRCLDCRPVPIVFDLQQQGGLSGLGSIFDLNLHASPTSDDFIRSIMRAGMQRARST